MGLVARMKHVTVVSANPPSANPLVSRELVALMMAVAALVVVAPIRFVRTVCVQGHVLTHATHSTSSVVKFVANLVVIVLWVIRAKQVFVYQTAASLLVQGVM